MKNKIVLTYAWGTPNAGDHALTLGAIELLLKYVSQQEITVISRFSSKEDRKDPTHDILNLYPNIEVLESPFKFSRKTVLNRFFEKIYGFIMLVIVVLSPRLSIKIYKQNAALKSISNAKIVLCNGGNLFYWNEHRKSLPRLLALGLPFIMAKKLHIPYGFLPQTMGPIENKLLLKYTNDILESAKFVLFRENKSFEYMKSFLYSGKTKIAEAPDLAFVVSDDYKLLEQDVFKALKNIGFEHDDKFIAITLRASKLGDPEGVTGQSVNDEAMKSVTKYIKEVVVPVAKERNLNILIVEQTDVDYETSHYFQQITQEDFPNKIAYISSRDPLFLSELYLQSECLVGMRLHSLIFALRVNKPAFAIYLKQFGPKTPGLYSSFGLSNYCVDMDEVPSSKCSSQLDIMLSELRTVETKISDVLSVELKKEYEFIRDFIE